MEVHHHSHSPRKRWSHYFWEFFMLFLAVSAGFLVENTREHYIERKRAKVFAASLLQDVRKDTAALGLSMEFTNNKINGMTNFISFLHQPRSEWTDSLLYLHANYITRVAPFYSSQGTYEQIKNSGSLRYFPQKLVGLLNSYEVYSIRAAERDALDSDFILETIIIYLSKRMNYEVFNDIIYSLPVTHARYNRIAPADVDEMINYAVISRRNRERSRIEYEKLLELANEIMTEVKRVYHLE